MDTTMMGMLAGSVLVFMVFASIAALLITASGLLGVIGGSAGLLQVCARRVRSNSPP